MGIGTSPSRRGASSAPGACLADLSENGGFVMAIWGVSINGGHLKIDNLYQFIILYEP